MKLIVGLGNPGKKYQNTRHNLGFLTIDALARKFFPLKEFKWEKDKWANSLILRVSPNILLVKPLTFMNSSGFAVASLTRRYKLDANHLCIIHDDIDLPLGKLKIKKGGGTAGHHGLESIVKSLGTGEFIRFRIGIGRPKLNYESGIMNYGSQEITDYVLKEFTKEEWKIIEKAVARTVEAIEYYLDSGLELTMNKFN